MQNLKGIIRAFTIILVIVCLIQLSFTFLARNVERKADTFATQRVQVNVDPSLSAEAKIAAEDSFEQLKTGWRRYYLDSVSSKPIAGMDFLNYRFCRDNALKLGLDLKGGMSLTLEIAEDDVLRRLAGSGAQDATFKKALANAKAAQSNNQSDFLTIFQQEYEKLAPNGKLAMIFANQENYQGKLTFNSTNAEVVKALRGDFDAAIEQTFKVLKTRIDQFGVASPNISLQKNTGRIILELPGVEDPTRVRKLLESTAQLEFWDTYDLRELEPSLRGAIEAAKLLNSKKEEPVAAVVDSTATVDSTGAAVTPAVDSAATAATPDTTEKSQVSPLIQVLQINADNQGVLQQGPMVGVALGKDTAAVNRILAQPAVKAQFPRDCRLLWSMKADRRDDRFYDLYAIKINTASPEAPLTGKVITDAYQDHDAMSGTFSVNLRMNSFGADKWEKMTGAAVEKTFQGKKYKGSVAIVLDNRVLTAPTVQGKIAGGNTQITGMDGIEDATDLANILKSGKLEAKTVIIEEQVVGPSLGKASIKAGLLSLGIGLLLVFLFMVAYYSSSGIIANIAMLLNLFILVCALISFGAAFTLPAMAGIILTLAMAVDANVIINERVREEVLRGKGLRLAVDEGYQHSYSAIVDGNLTTMVAAIVLMVFGLGPIYGFGFTLFIGLLTSMFTAVLVSRLMFDFAFARNWNITFGNSFTMNLFKHINFDFIGKRKISYTVSSILFVVSFASMVFYGFDFGVDFKGGRSYVVQFDKDVTVEQISKVLEGPLGSAPQVKTYGSNNQVSITTPYLIDKQGPEIDSTVEAKVYEGLKGVYTQQPSLETFRTKNVKSSVKIEASIADDIRKSALWAILFGVGGIFLYIFVRFRKLEYAAGAVVALIHDPVLILGIFSLFRHVMPFSLEIDQNIVAAVLTLIGYSVNDTVVVFDRIREYVNLHPTRTLTQNTNDSINSTLSRTIMTVVTVFLVSLILFLFGGTPIRGFSFALIIGLLVGTYSSIFIASPIMVDIAGRKNKAKE
ncbi:MAG: protein translocase subunit SecDF [Chitinophagales bacterium]